MYPSLQASLWGLLLGLIAIPWASAKAPYELSLSQLEARYADAAAHADKVQRLILINAAGMPRTAATDPNRARGSALSQWIRARYQSKGYWRDSLVGQFTGGTVPPETLIQRTYDMNRREDGKTYAKKFMRNFRTGDPEAELAKVRAPTLIAWGMGNITVSHLEANVFQLWLTGAPSMLIKYPKLGHYACIEEPDLIAKDFEDFLLGRHDDELRITQRANLNEVSDH